MTSGLSGATAELQKGLDDVGGQASQTVSQALDLLPPEARGAVQSAGSTISEVRSGGPHLLVVNFCP